MKVLTRFGEVDITDKSHIKIQDGLVGLPQAQTFALLTVRDDSPFHWLQCLEEPAVSLAVISPMDFFKEYSFELQDADVDALGLEAADDAVVLTTVTVDEDARCVTTNLLGPIVVNKTTLQAKQVILSSESFPAKQKLFELHEKKVEHANDGVQARAA